MSGFVGYTVTGGLLMSLLRLPDPAADHPDPDALHRHDDTDRTEPPVGTGGDACGAGLSVWQFIMPFVFGAFLIGVFSTFVINPVGAWGQSMATNMETNWRKASNAAKPSNFLPWIRQISGDSDTVIGAKSYENGGTELFDVALFHFDANGRIFLRQDAASATLEDGYWQLNNVLETRTDAPPARKASAQVRTNLKREFLQESITKPETVAFFDILRKVEAARSFGISTKALETQFHSLLSLPLLLVAMTLIAATVSLRFSRMAQSGP